MFDVGVPEAPGSCRQRMGHADVWELHQASLVAYGTDVGSNWPLTRVAAEARMNMVMDSMVLVEPDGN